MIRHDWTHQELLEIYQLPFPELMLRAQLTHHENFPGNTIQRSTLLSIKTGACPEDCAYCPQSAHYKTEVEKHSLLPLSEVMQHAQEAKDSGSTRFCMGAAWREVREGKDFEQVLELVRGVSSIGLEVCCTLGMMNLDQATRLREAGCYAYNHNLDTSPEYYKQIITTRTYEDRLNTLRNVRAAGITVCCGGIVGMGESLDHRIGLLRELATQQPHPESVPLNMLVKVQGTPLHAKLQQAPQVDPLDFVRLVATARIAMPESYVRLSAGRLELSNEAQALCFVAGANSIFAGEKLLTTPNPEVSQDDQLVRRLGMKFQEVSMTSADSCGTFPQGNTPTEFSPPLP